MWGLNFDDQAITNSDMTHARGPSANVRRVEQLWQIVGIGNMLTTLGFKNSW
jgi:hypothetical protein